MPTVPENEWPSYHNFGSKEYLHVVGVIGAIWNSMRRRGLYLAIVTAALRPVPLIAVAYRGAKAWLIVGPIKLDVDTVDEGGATPLRLIDHAVEGAQRRLSVGRIEFSIDMLAIVSAEARFEVTGFLIIWISVGLDGDQALDLGFHRFALVAAENDRLPAITGLTPVPLPRRGWREVGEDCVHRAGLLSGRWSGGFRHSSVCEAGKRLSDGEARVDVTGMRRSCAIHNVSHSEAPFRYG